MQIAPREQTQLLEMENIIQSIGFTQFVEKTAPKTQRTNLPRLAQSLVNRLAQDRQIDENGNFGIIRGGSMRSFLLDNYVTDDRFAEVFSHVDPSLLGEDPLALRVINKVFSLPKDIDIFLRSQSSDNQGQQHDALFFMLADELKLQWFTPINISGNGDNVVFSNGQYQVTLLKHQTGINHPQTLVKVNISQGNEALLKLHLGYIPDDVEMLEHPRFFEESADIDQEALGYLSHDNRDIIIRYFGSPDISYANSYLYKHFFDPLQHPFEVDEIKKPDQVIAARLREINFRVALISWLFSVKGVTGIDADFQHSPYYELFLRYSMQYERKRPNREKITAWFANFRANIQDNRILTASDAIYGITVNPFLFFLFAFPTHILDAFPLGSELEFESLRHFLQSLAIKIGGDISTDSLLTLSNRYYIYLRSAGDTAIFQLLEFMKKSPTVSSFLKLTDCI